MMELAAVAPVADDLVAPLAPALGKSTDTEPGSAGSFESIFSQGISKVNESLIANHADLQRLASGDVQNLHQVMIGMEESRISFQLMVQVRNRLLEAYQDIMKMQI
jgi:flagellar hook-basal body complex protein FliE